MQTQIINRNIVFDPSNALCGITIALANVGQRQEKIAFLTVLDISGIDINKAKKCHQRKYCGIIEWAKSDDDAIDIFGHGKVSVQSLINVMDYGGKWSKFES